MLEFDISGAGWFFPVMRGRRGMDVHDTLPPYYDNLIMNAPSHCRYKRLTSHARI